MPLNSFFFSKFLTILAFRVSFRESAISLYRLKATLGADLSIAFYQIKNSTNKMLKKIEVNTNETYQ